MPPRTAQTTRTTTTMTRPRRSGFMYSLTGTTNSRSVKPSGAKAPCFVGHYGTAEAVPLPTAYKNTDGFGGQRVSRNRPVKVQYSMGGGKCCLTPLLALSMMQRGRNGTLRGEEFNTRARPKRKAAGLADSPCATTEKRNPRAARLRRTGPTTARTQARRGSVRAADAKLC